MASGSAATTGRRARRTETRAAPVPFMEGTAPLGGDQCDQIPLEHLMADFLWFFAVGIAPFLVAAVLIYALVRRRRLSAREKAARDRKTRELYGDSDRLRS